MQHTNGMLYGLPNAGGVSNGGVFYSLLWESHRWSR